MRLHESVLREEVLDFLTPVSGGVIVDGTLGAGGHSEVILERLKPRLLIGFDRDPAATQAAEKILCRFGESALILKDNFARIPERLKELGFKGVQGVLLDLGVSSMQFDEAGRGFSFRFDGPLDMRMSPDERLTAQDIVNTYSERELEGVLHRFGEERWARRISKGILAARHRRVLRTTAQLAEVISESVPRAYRYGRLHPATRTFQALRMEVNHELESLETFLAGLPAVLASHGRAVIISFQSLEDRAVKTAFKEFKAKGLGDVLTKKPWVPDFSEVERNPRSRSAKLRVFEKF
jgi:16S rRNA (cytosine1402-N4)-methyltransferase